MTFTKKIKNAPIAMLFIWTWTCIRILSVFLLWWSALFGFVINILLDAVDGDILERLSVKRSLYENWDKYLDIWFYIVLAIYIYNNVSHGIIWSTLLFLFLYRMVGSVLFSIYQKKWILFIFPNVFTELFFVSIIFPNYIKTNFTLVLLAVVIFSLFKEWWIHIAKLDLTNILTNRKKKWK